jgi:hypothetical protein
MTSEGILVSTSDNQMQMVKQGNYYVVLERKKAVSQPLANIVKVYATFCEIASANLYTLEDYVFHKTIKNNE